MHFHQSTQRRPGLRTRQRTKAGQLERTLKQTCRGLNLCHSFFHIHFHGENYTILHTDSQPCIVFLESGLSEPGKHAKVGEIEVVRDRVERVERRIKERMRTVARENR